MIGKLLAQLLGNDTEDGADVPSDATVNTKSEEDLLEIEDGDWVVININEGRVLTPPLVDPLEDLLIEHPSMSVYKLRRHVCDGDKDKNSGDEGEDFQRLSLPVRRCTSWRVMACTWSLVPHSCALFPAQRARLRMETRKLSRSVLHRQNLAKGRFSAAERRYGHSQQPRQRLYNY